MQEDLVEGRRSGVGCASRTGIGGYGFESRLDITRADFPELIHISGLKRRNAPIARQVCWLQRSYTKMLGVRNLRFPMWRWISLTVSDYSVLQYLYTVGRLLMTLEVRMMYTRAGRHVWV